MNDSIGNPTERTAIDAERRRAAGFRVAAAMAVIGLISGMALATWPPVVTGGGARGLSTEWYGVDAPADVDDSPAQDVATAACEPGAFDEPELVVNHEQHG